ncbi:MAG: hypothetical protein K0R78_3391 [Pelosinus sp.]|jgi:hypothetical protein|nr:hypothetical protein [Pelosinus sp.]
MKMYYLHYDETTGLIIGAPYHSAIHGKEVPVYNTEPIITEIPEVDESGNNVIGEDDLPIMKIITQEIGTMQTGTVLDLSAIPTPHIEITDNEHGDWMQNQATRKVDIRTKKLVEYTPPEPAPVIITPTTDQDLADVWEAIFALSAEKEGGI